MVLAALLGAGVASHAATAPENLFQSGAQKLKAGFYQQAEADFAEFVQKFPNSPLLPDAVLFQVEARVRMTNYDGALGLLAVHQAQAGKRADEYLFWQAEALSQKGELKSAADLFSKLARDFPDSPRRLEATVRESAVRARLSEWPRVLDLLRQTNGVFQAAVRANVTNDMLVRGYLLLSEAYLRNAEYGLAEQALGPLSDQPLKPQFNWQRQYLLCRVLSGTGKNEPALAAVTNLVALAAPLGNPESQADSLALYAELLERQGRPADALGAYQQNLASGVPADRQRQALLRFTELSLTLGKLDEAAQAIQKFIQQCPNATCSDLALLTFGELHLRQYQSGFTNVPALPATTNAVAAPGTTNAPALTDRREIALAAFQSFTNKFGQSPLLGKALLDLGWCFWLKNRWAEAEAAFQSAVQRLPLSADQATAWFKLGDAQFRQTNYNGAVTSYTAVVEKFGSIPGVTNTLFEPALYEIVRAGLAKRDLPTATNALAKILAWFPNGFHTDRAVLLAGQEVGHYDPAAARKLFSEVANHSSGSALLPELKLAIARTYEQEDRWTEAIEQYSAWLEAFTNHEAQARAEYSRARACFQAKQETNAFVYFTNFLAHFPTNEFAPLAQWWVAGYYYRVIGDLKAAEQNYQLIYQNTNWPVTELTYQARMMAGRAAFDRQGWNDAQQYYFKPLINDSNCPPTVSPQAWIELRAQAWIAYGDTLISQDPTNITQAVIAYNQVLSLCPSNELAALALGQKASCLLQSQDYASATNFFQQVLDSPAADARARCIATVGLGVTFEKIAQAQTGSERAVLFDVALSKYLDVFYGKILVGDERPDSFWTREAGLKAARLAESLRLYRQAASVYERLQELFPPLRLEARITKLKALEQESGQTDR